MTKTKTRVAAFVVLTVFLLLAGVACFILIGIRNKTFFLNDFFVSEQDVRGVDVSNHQVNVDMNKLREQGLQFVYIKATEGSAFTDDYFDRNWQNAKDAGLLAGAYHFFSFQVDGKSQALNFITAVGEDITGRLVPVVDMETPENSEAPLEKATIVRELKDFIAAIDEAYGVKPMIYAQKDFYDKYLADDFADYPLWVRSVYYPATWGGGDNWILWQYKDRGELEGYSGGEKYIDLDVLNHKRSLDEITVK